MSGEFRGKIVIEADDRQVQMTHRSVKDLTGTFMGLQGVLRGSSALMKGNASGMVDMAMGASLAWRTLSNLHPYLRIIAIAMAVLPPIIGAVQKAFGKTTEIDDFTAKLKKLGLIEGDLDKLQRALKRNADALKTIKDNADSAASAYDRLLQAQRAVAAIRQDVAKTKLDLEERQALANPNLTEDQRRDIRKTFGERRIDMEAEHEIEITSLSLDGRKAELSGIGDEREQRKQQGIQLTRDAMASGGALLSEINRMMRDGEASFDKKALESIERFSKGNLSELDKHNDLSKILTGLKAGADTKELESLFGAAKEARREERSFASRTDASNKMFDKREGAVNLEIAALEVKLGGGPDSIQALAESKKSTLSAELSKEEVQERRRVMAAEGRYRYDKADPEQQMAYINRRLETLSGTALSVEQREQRLELLKERDRVQEGMNRNTDRQAIDQASREARVADARQGLSDLRRSSSFSVDTSELFEAMHAGGASNTEWGKAVIEDRARQQVDLLKQIAENTKGETV